MIVDLLLEALYSMVYWVADLIPRLPASVIQFVDRWSKSFGELFAGIPYAHLVPWTTINTLVALLPLVYGIALLMSIIRRAWALIRSRGISEQ